LGCSQGTKYQAPHFITESNSFFMNACPARGVGMLSSYLICRF
jgi:hypothetical protein